MRARITLKDGRSFEQRIAHAVGSIERPMSDADLDAKFLGLTDGVIADARARAVIDACRRVDSLATVATLAQRASLADAPPSDR